MVEPRPQGPGGFFASGILSQRRSLQAAQQLGSCPERITLTDRTWEAVLLPPGALVDRTCRGRELKAKAHFVLFQRYRVCVCVRVRACGHAW